MATQQTPDPIGLKSYTKEPSKTMKEAEFSIGMDDLQPVPSLAVGSVEDSSQAIDEAILRAQGHKAELPRLFSPLSSMGLMFCIMNSWIGALSTFGQGLRYGGAQAVIFSLLAATAIQWILTLGLAELASAFPSSGGQYHFMYILAPPKYKKFAAFVIGWMSVLAWWLACTAGLSQVAVATTGLASFANPSYEPKSWHIYLCYVAMTSIGALPLFLIPKSIPRFISVSMFLSLTAFVVCFVVMLAMRQQTNSGDFVTASGQGNSGWSPGVAWVLAVSNALFCYGGTDSAIHIAEEMHSPGRNLPIVMNLTMLTGTLTAVPVMVVAMFTISDPDAVMNASFPAIELIYQVTGNRPLTIFLSVWLIVIYASALPPQFVASGRIAWAFARDRGTMFPDYFSHVDTKLQFPARATLAALAFNVIYGLLYLVSTTAFNSIITSAVLYINITIAAPQILLVFRGRDKMLPERPFKLGLIGWLCNVFALCWIPVLIVLVCMPPALPIAVESMNYTSPILVGIVVIIVGGYFVFGKHFEGPNIDWDMLNAGNRLEHEMKTSSG